jgi:hypothetical protein
MLFLHEKCIETMWKMCGKCVENIALNILCGICAMFSRYVFSTSLEYNTCGSCSTSMRL